MSIFSPLIALQLITIRDASTTVPGDGDDWLDPCLLTDIPFGS
jgi:hypothetical protein